MGSSQKQGKTSNSETGQIPRSLLEAYREAAAEFRESAESGEDQGSITGIFKMRKRTEGVEKNQQDDAPLAGSSAETAKQ